MALAELSDGERGRLVLIGKIGYCIDGGGKLSF
jgi:hypothetical protein